MPLLSPTQIELKYILSDPICAVLSLLTGSVIALRVPKNPSSCPLTSLTYLTHQSFTSITSKLVCVSDELTAIPTWSLFIESGSDVCNGNL